jgi:hypothetical protein
MNLLNKIASDEAADVPESGGDGVVTRRTVLRRSALVASAAALGAGAMGTATANGKGGQSAVPSDDYVPGRALHFEEWTGRLVRQTCDKGGNGIVLAEWRFHYEGEDEQRYIYTRDNAIDTSVKYTLAGKGATDCGEFYLTPFSPVRD